MISDTELSTVPAESQAPSVGDLLADLRRIRDEKDRLNEQLSALNKQEDALKAKLLSYHEASGLDRVANDQLTVSFKESIRGKVDPERWKEFFAWAVATGNTHVCYRQISSTKLAELAQNGEALPEGVTLETYTDVNIRRK